jgi:hypothetical protein
MSPEKFQQAMARADAMTLAGREPAYWCGYKRGLQRAYLGRRFSTNTDHYAWLDFARDADPFVVQLGRGYRAGLEVVASGQSPMVDGHAAQTVGPPQVVTVDDATATSRRDQKS